MQMVVNGLPNLKIELIAGVLEMLGDGSETSVTELTQAFHRQGLGHIIESWIDDGPKLAISAQQVAQVLGEARIRHLAARARLTTAEVVHGLTYLLPQVIDQLTPGGSLAETMSRSMYMRSGLAFLRQITHAAH